MNWLAHIVLSRQTIDYQLGNLLADPLKGRVWAGASEEFIQGVTMHKAIDVYTDKNPIVAVSKSRLGEKGYLRGVILDVLFDHFLSAQWNSYVQVPFEDFISEFSEQALVTVADYPQQAIDFIHQLLESERLSRYAEFDDCIETLSRIDERLSRRVRAKESTSDYIKSIEMNYDYLKADFECFFPELVHFFTHHEFGSKNEHVLFLK